MYEESSTGESNNMGEEQENITQLQKTLVVVDFDLSLIDVNSDWWLLEKVAPHLREKSASLWEEFLKTDNRWAVFLDYLLGLLHDEGVKEEHIRAAFQDVPVHPQMVEAIKLCHSAGCDLVIVSGCCTYIIHTVLESYKIKEYYSAIHAHHFTWEGTRLRVHPYHSDDSPPGSPITPKKHTCSQCPADLCKGAILGDYLSTKKYHRICYLGDSTNDYCPCTLLTQSDHVLARKGHNLHLLSESPTNEPLGYGDVPSVSASRPPLHANLHLWESGEDVLQIFENILQKQ